MSTEIERPGPGGEYGLPAPSNTEEILDGGFYNETDTLETMSVSNNFSDRFPIIPFQPATVQGEIREMSITGENKHQVKCCAKTKTCVAVIGFLFLVSLAGLGIYLLFVYELDDDFFYFDDFFYDDDFCDISSEITDDVARSLINDNIIISETTLLNFGSPCLPENAFQELSVEKLEELELIETFLIESRQLKSIDTLAFNGVNFSSVSVIELNSLEELTLIDEAAFEGFSELNQLIITECPLVDFSVNIYGETELNNFTLELESNELSGFPPLIGFQSDYKRVSVRDNFISGLVPDVFRNVERLEELDLRQNFILENFTFSDEQIREFIGLDNQTQILKD